MWSWWNGATRFLAWLGVLALLLVAIGRLELGAWGAERGLGLPSLMLLGWVAGPALAAWTYVDLRQARLLLFALLVPLPGGVQALWDTGLLRESAWLGEAAPRLIPALESAVARLLPLSYVALPGMVLLSTWLPPDPGRLRPRRRLALTWALLGVAAGLWLLLAPEQPELAPWGGIVLCALAAVAAGVALVLWRSEVGLGGSVAGLVLGFLLLGLAGLEGGETPLVPLLRALDATPETVEGWGRLPAGSGRALLHLVPLLFAGLVVHEWVATLAYRTRHDALTQIYNKSFAESIVNQTGAMSLGARFAVALLDIDHFKKVNDTHGHGAGDVVLHQVAQTIRTVVATRGVVCRTGGEEITVFFPGSSSEQAREVCEEVRQAVERTSVRASSNEGRSLRLKVTISIGVASNLDQNGQPARERVREVVEAADRAVYAAKHGGRNQVVVAAD
jgi:diguanylate cyclase (GGDEF)-like protein